MQRNTRVYLPGVPAHIVQRGNNRNTCLFTDDNYLYCLQVLGEGLRRSGTLWEGRKGSVVGADNWSINVGYQAFCVLYARLL